jgi:alpha-tubulin suppressor-like RCC1 family protein
VGQIVKKLYDHALGNGIFQPPAGVRQVNAIAIAKPLFNAVEGASFPPLVYLLTPPQYCSPGGGGGGILYQWGFNNYIGCGVIGGSGYISTPTLVVGGYSWMKYFGDGVNEANFGITNTGALYGWGYGPATYPQLGFATPTTFNSSPTLVSGGINTFIHIFMSSTNAQGSNGGGSTFGLTSGGQVYAWGYNAAGELGTNSVALVSTPTLISNISTLGVKDLFSRRESTYAITMNGAMYGWGFNSFGRLGTGASTAAYSTPTLVSGTTVWQSFARVRTNDMIDNMYYQYAYSASTEGMFAWDTSGNLWGWGNNSFGFLGVNSSTAAFSSPVLISGVPEQIAQVYCNDGQFQTYFLTMSGAVYACGQNANGMFGIGHFAASYSSPILISNGLSFKRISMGGGMCFGLTQDGQIYSWGTNYSGILGQNSSNTSLAQSTPTLISGTYSHPFTDIFLDSYTPSIWALAADGGVWAWGANAGQLGNGNVAPQSSPVFITGNVSWIRNVPPPGGGFTMFFSPNGVGRSVGSSGYGGQGLPFGITYSTPTLMTGFNIGAGFTVNPTPQSNTQIAVNPGQNYQITFTPMGIMFGGTLVGGIYSNRLEIQYEI